MGKNDQQPTNGPYPWGKGPQPKPKGLAAKLIAWIERKQQSK